MCGFAGFHARRNFGANAEDVVRKMGDRLRHRGPDDSGEWIGPVVGMALAFRRLAIVDLSPLGHQPMVSADGRFILTFNGEIYNWRALRAELEREGHSFRGHGDTEVLLEGIRAWGLEAALQRAVGMFALALVDVRGRQLSLARDRMGEKPLFYGWCNDHFFFGSELKAFRPHPSFAPEVDRGGLTLYLRYGYIPSPHCILAGFHKLLPGHILSLPLDGSAASGKEALKPYWSLPKPGEQGYFQGSAEDCAGELEELLREAIRLQMVADVPVGVFLSGGIDSSTVVSLMQAQATMPVRTFSIGFPDAGLDESGYAERVAAHLGTDHTAWHCVDSELLALAEQVPRVYCEPFADDAQLPTLALARMARRQVTVALSGDGGDELFHGYRRYERTIRRWQQLRQHPSIETGWRLGIKMLSAPVGLLSDSPLKRRLTSKLGKAREQWLAADLPAFYRHRASLNKTPGLFLRQPEALREFFDEAAPMAGLQEDAACLSYLDLHTYLPDDILVKVDRAAMAFSLETRMPLLDHRIVEFAARTPVALKMRDGRSKWPLRRILERRVPLELTERPKMGFNTPLARWLRGPLREWGEAHLGAERLRRENFFHTEEVRRFWDQHQQGRRDRSGFLWNVLMFQAWNDSF